MIVKAHLDISGDCFEKKQSLADIRKALLF